MNLKLWQRILAYNPDQPGSEYPFSVRLARENYWTRNFTEKAILEYKKFMYLAATSDFMVSPSPVIDAVWHQHLIFTQSYHEFCELLGKRIEHVPSTRNPEEAEKFRHAKERTQERYKELFGEQPADCWQFPDMYASLSLEKSGIKLRAFLLWGILGFVLLLVPAYFTLGLVYPKIDNPYFIFAYLLLIAAAFGALDLYNRNHLSGWVNRVNPDSFLLNLQPAEVIYLRDHDVKEIIYHELNLLVKKGVLKMGSKMRIQVIEPLPKPTPEESMIISTVQDFRTASRSNTLVVFKRLQSRLIFHNAANAMDAFLKYFQKSKFFGKLFRLNFYLAAFIYLLGITRLFTGIIREKPVGFLAVLLVLLLVGIVWYLRRLQLLIARQIIPDFYEETLVKNMEWPQRSEWKFFVLGHTTLAPALVEANRYLNRQDDSGSGGSSGCGSSCGSGCGSSCGGCGGGGD